MPPRPLVRAQFERCLIILVVASRNPLKGFLNTSDRMMQHDLFTATFVRRRSGRPDRLASRNESEIARK
jgi:hypothetical protein